MLHNLSCPIFLNSVPRIKTLPLQHMIEQKKQINYYYYFQKLFKQIELLFNIVYYTI